MPCICALRKSDKTFDIDGLADLQQQADLQLATSPTEEAQAPPQGVESRPTNAYGDLFFPATNQTAKVCICVVAVGYNSNFPKRIPFLLLVCTLLYSMCVLVTRRANRLQQQEGT